MKCKHIGLALGMVLLAGHSVTLRAQVFTTQHTFTNMPDGANPRQLAWLNGLFYASTANGGTSGNGSIFKFDTNGLAFTTIYSFAGTTNDGSFPNNVTVAGSTIYGTTFYGGTNGLGMIFAVNTNGAGFTPLYSFGPAPDGDFPQAGLVLNGGTLYGTTHGGGTNASGTVFKINTNGTSYSILHCFTNSPDGSAPISEVVSGGGTLYGTTFYGGAGNKGMIFAVNTDGSSYTILHNFTNAPDGNFPFGGLLLNSGVLYGTTYGGGTNYNGTIFAINTDGSGYRILYSFSGATSNYDGMIPKGTLTFNGGYLYGTTAIGGGGSGGTLFQINTNGAGFAVLRSFNNNAASGYDLENGVLLAGTSLWGTTYQGGLYGYGTLYSLLLPVITAQPQSLIVTNGSPAALTVNAADVCPLSYQWYFNTNTLLTSKTNSTLNFASITTTNAGAYTVVVADACNAVTSMVAALTVVSPPVIISQPADQSQPIGNTAGFAVSASGDAPLAYQWYFNSGVLNGATNAGLSLGPLLTNQAGGYQMIITNASGSATSRQAQLTVLLQPNEYGISNGGGNFTVFMASLPGSTNRLWTTTNLPAPPAQWRVIATNVAGANGLFQFADTNVSGSNAKFYRLSLP